MMNLDLAKTAESIRQNRFIPLLTLTVIYLLFSFVFIKMNFFIPPPKETATAAKNVKRETLQNNTLYIPSLALEAPIIWKVDGFNKTEYFKALESGVAHFKGTSLPGEKGNCVIFGHSNFYRKAKGKYKKIFSHLDKLKKGDKIIITFKNRKNIYYVAKTFLVNPEDIWVIHPTQTETLTLLTCWPPGSISKRMVVRALKEKTSDGTKSSNKSN